ncbi:coiled-coil domain-containing protein 113 isoform X1 [Hypomesus transpacificus]|uniref:coiled-coil domain-containing protein 113 isoform X1 n=1 Tax=Hypomesus transpacificus TaxID=137520 RepID=UPI001F080D52|nr:coiled-coil domain-containing protein 113 isoform X1 [Hypomesus transpacificus]
MAEVEEILSEAEKRHIVKLIADLRRSNAVLRAETDMYERYINRIDPRDMILQPPSESQGATQPEAGTSRRKSKAKTAAVDCKPQLTPEQKCDIAHRELDETREDLEKLKESTERVLHNYKATLEEADIRLVELKKASYEFDRDVAKVLKEKRGVIVAAEKIVRYMEDRMRAKDTLMEKLRLRSAALQVQKRKLQLQLRQKEEMGEALLEVDFKQLKIENSQYLERIDERNADLLRLKLQAGNTLQVLNSYKKKLQIMTCESMLLSSDITSRKDMLVKIEEEALQAEEVTHTHTHTHIPRSMEDWFHKEHIYHTSGVEHVPIRKLQERLKAETLNRKLRGQLADYRVPHVLQYITAKDSHSQLEQSVRTWERKVEISEMALKTHTKAWNKVRASVGAGPGPGPITSAVARLGPITGPVAEPRPTRRPGGGAVVGW